MQDRHGSERRINTYDAGEYFGELPLLLGAPALASLRALEPSRVARLDVTDFAELFSACEHFSSELTRTMQRVNASSAMPSYYRTAGLDRVADTYQGRPVLDALQVEDIVAYLATLK